MQWNIIIGLFGGIGGAFCTLLVQTYRDRARRKRMANACEALLRKELSMLWFDMAGTLSDRNARVFARQTEAWDTFKGQLPDLFEPDQLTAVASAYYLAKDLEYRVKNGTVLDFQGETDDAMTCIVHAIHVLGGDFAPSEQTVQRREALKEIAVSSDGEDPTTPKN